MAGEQDHYVRLHQFHDQIRTLRNIRTLTARLFTRAEQAQNHCQIGNIALALQVITAWLDAMTHAQSALTPPQSGVPAGRDSCR